MNKHHSSQVPTTTQKAPTHTEKQRTEEEEEPERGISLIFLHHHHQQALQPSMTNMKRYRPTKDHHQSSTNEYQELLPGLPDHLSQLCLSHVQNPSLLYSVCLSWRRLIYSPSFPPFLSLYALLSSSNSIHFSSFDPISSKWIPLPPPPTNPLIPPFLLRHPSFIARNLPIQSVSISNHLVLLAATTHHLLPALSHPLIFNPLSNQWHLGRSISTPRRWCAVGSVNGSLYVASGVGSGYNKEVAQSVERWDLKKDWEKVSPLKDSRFSREAVEAVGWRGKLCMVNVKGNVVKEGVVYDVEKDLWEDMPKGMLIGWSGPAGAMDEDVIYAVDEVYGILRKYNPDFDCWEDVIESTQLKGAVQVVAGGGRVCIVCSGGDSVAVIDVGIRPARMWVVDPPPAMQLVAIHVLPRMSMPENCYPQRDILDAANVS